MLPAGIQREFDEGPEARAEGTANPRGAAIAALYAHAATLAAAGDLAGARALHEAIGAMLGGGAGGDVVDLAARRSKKGGREG